jgi:hypothetical protein
MDTTQATEVDRNFEEFKKLLPSLLQEHKGQFALMRDARIVSYYPSFADALTAARKSYSDKRFSIQEVTDWISGLGFFTNAVS